MMGKVAVVTGSSRGIGRAIAVELARKGCRLVVNFSNNLSAAEEVLEEIRQQWHNNRCRCISSRVSTGTDR